MRTMIATPRGFIFFYTTSRVLKDRSLLVKMGPASVQGRAFFEGCAFYALLCT